MFFGERKPGIPELGTWRQMIQEFLDKEELCIQ
jgi:putative heme degradation protein